MIDDNGVSRPPKPRVWHQTMRDSIRSKFNSFSFLDFLI